MKYFGVVVSDVEGGRKIIEPDLNVSQVRAIVMNPVYQSGIY